MDLISAAATAFSGAAARVRGYAVAYAIVALCAAAAAVLLSSASVLALEPNVGAVYARLIVGAVFVLIAAAVVLWLHFARRGSRGTAPLSAHASPNAGLRRQTQFAQIAMIVEAVMLGYSLSRRSDRR